MPDSFVKGLMEGLSGGMEQKRTSDKERANLILKGVIEGNVTPKTDIAQPNIGKRIMSSLGIGQNPEADISRYNVQPNLENQVRAENLKYMQNINKQMSGEGGGSDTIARRVDTGEEVPLAQAQADIAKGNTNYIISRKDISKSGIKETVLTKPEDLEKSRANKEQSEFIVSQAQDNLDTIAEVKKGLNNFGFKGQFLPKEIVPGTPYFNWKTNLEKLLSGKIVELITKMKSTSKTGATGFGQLSDREGQILKEASTALKAGLAPKDAQKYLDKMEVLLNKIVSGKGNTTTQQSQKEETGTSVSEGSVSTTPYQTYLKSIGQ